MVLLWGEVGSGCVLGGQSGVGGRCGVLLQV
jgi:hypothetical protein